MLGQIAEQDEPEKQLDRQIGGEGICRSRKRTPSQAVAGWLEFRLMAAYRRYLYIEQLAERTPWTAEAIRTMIRRGTFKLGLHYFKPHGPTGRPIFSWDAIVKYIEGDAVSEESGEVIPLADGTVINLNEAATKANRLRG